MGIDWKNYKYPELYDELITDKGKPRKVAQALARQLAKYGDEELERLKATAELSIKEMGISFTVYDQEGGSIDRQWPFDIIPE